MTKIDICNMALFFLGNTLPIKSFTEKTAESLLCDRYYDISRELLLAEYPWSFAKKSFVALTEVTDETNERYTYIYEYPSDALRVLSVGDGAETDGVMNNFEIIYTLDEANNSVKRVVCDIAEAKAEYIIDLQDENAFTAHFCEALAWKIASMIGVGLTKDSKSTQYAMQMAQVSANNAKYMEALQQHKPINQGNRYISARR